jgi:hypothetical protein
MAETTFKTLASSSKERFVLSKCWLAFRRRKLRFQNSGEDFKGKFGAFKMLASVSKKQKALSKL